MSDNRPGEPDRWSPLDRFAPDEPEQGWTDEQGRAYSPGQTYQQGRYQGSYGAQREPELFTHDTVGGWGPPAPPPPPPPRGRRGWLVALGLLLALALVGGLVTVAVLAAQRSRSTTAAPVTAAPAPSPTTTTAAPTTTTAPACTAAAPLTGTSATLGGDGLRLGFAATAGCADGQVLTGPVDVRVLDGDVQVAGATVDLTATPLGLPAGTPGRLTVVFPYGSYDVVPSQARAGVLTATATPSTTSTATPPADAPAEVTVTAGPPLAPPGDPEAAALAALRRQAEVDRPDVDTRLAERWQPQISSKQAGLTVAGAVLDQQAVLADHLQLRARYPDARLVFSTDWTNYRGDDFWVTLSGVTFPAPGGALGWCDQEGYGPSNCVAVLLSRTAGPDGTFATR